MKVATKRVLAAGVISLSLCGRAAADPHRDANAADAHGDYAAELVILRPNADQGHAWAQNNLGTLYAAGNGVAQDHTKAVYWFRKAADQGDKGGEINLGQAYQHGDGVPLDSAKAAALYLAAARQGSEDGAPLLELLCMSDGLGDPRECAQVVPLLTAAADKGDAKAQSSLAELYDSGAFPGLSKDPQQATVWYRKAAESGDADAQTSLAQRYEFGLGGEPTDDAQAAAWMRKAADQGGFFAEMDLASRYENGRGVPKDAAQAFYWNRKVAEHGVSDAQRKVGAAYATGDGVAQDYIQAFTWLEVARLTEVRMGRQAGDVETIALDGVASHLTPAQLDEARKRAAAWKVDAAELKPAKH